MLSSKTKGGARSYKVGSRAESVYLRLLEAINEGSLRPGERLREVEIAGWLNVSRTPVREALHRLESEEIIVKSEHGLIVPLMDDAQILQLYAMREVLEGAAAALAAQHASAVQIQLLGKIIDDETAAEDADAQYHAFLNKQFHAAIYHAANNKYLLKSLKSLQDAIGRLQATTFSWPGRPKLAIREHRGILRAIAKRDAAAAESLARAHIREALRYRMLLIHQARTMSPKNSAKPHISSD